MIKRLLLAASAAVLLSTSVPINEVQAAPAQVSRPQPPPQPAPQTTAIPVPRDVAYPGTIKLTVDATDLDRRIFEIRETIPVRPGPVTLLYPMWRPGGHSPSGELNKLAGLIVTANGKRLDWKRDPVEVAAFHLNVPAGTTSLEVQYQFLSATAPDQGRVVVSPDMMNVQWLALAMYPAGYYTRQIQVQPNLKLPSGWDYAGALETASKSGDTVAFKPVDFDTLVDSPLFAGRYVKKVELDTSGKSRVTLNLVADAPDLLDYKPDHIDKMKAMVTQADRLYGARHYDHYDFLIALGDKIGGIGLEHQRSTEIRSIPKFFGEWDKSPQTRNVFPHEYTHSWDGKYRRPADLWTPNYNTPMRDSLLWVYEGQTQYWGFVLGARSALVTKQETLDAIAATAALYDARIGHDWRQLEDTTNDPIINTRRPIPWTSWQRSEDYYSEGQLVWLDADTLIRERSNGQKSLDDFAKAFFGVNDGDWRQPLTYDFDEVVRTLNGVVPYDWASFLKARLEGHGKAPLDGITRGGYKLVFTDTATEYAKAVESRAKVTDLTYSAGMVVDNSDGSLAGVQWEGPAFKAGLTVSTRIVAVNGVAFDSDRLKAAVSATKTGGPLELIVRNGERYRTVKIDWKGGLRYPRLERLPNTPDRLGDILNARAN